MTTTTMKKYEKDDRITASEVFEKAKFEASAIFNRVR